MKAIVQYMKIEKGYYNLHFKNFARVNRVVDPRFERREEHAVLVEVLIERLQQVLNVRWEVRPGRLAESFRDRFGEHFRLALYRLNPGRHVLNIGR
jgi:hypothetical protein